MSRIIDGKISCMKALGIETSGNRGGIALLDGGKVLKEILLKKGMVHGKLLIAAIDKALKTCRWKKTDIDLIAVDIGPGSYTGLRVGLAAAKMMSYLLNIPMVGVSSLDALMQEINTKHLIACPVIDARWNQVYTAIYRKNAAGWKKVTDFMAITPSELAKLLKEYSLKYGKTDKSPNIILFGDGLLSYNNILNGLPGIESGSEKYWYPKPANIVRLGYKRWHNKQKDTYWEINPLYLRKTEAEITLKKVKK
ncbi:MAG: tRNA (adenosine(37)-N6)-threonylcarbamoyltransferase complex dimerization subunit type 1 TsaB [Candidatus Brocadiia bacterium]